MAARKTPAEQRVNEGFAIEYPPSQRNACTMPDVGVERRRQAMARYDEAIALDPHLAKAYLARGSAWRRLGDHKRARADLSTALKLGPTEPYDYLRISFGFEGKKQRGILRAGIRRCRPGSQTHFHLANYLANLHWYDQRYDLELRALRRLKRAHPNFSRGNPGAMLALDEGKALRALDRLAAAEQAYRRSLGFAHPLRDLAATAMIECRIYRGDLDGARQVLREVGHHLGKLRVAIMRAYLDAVGEQAIACPAWLRRKLRTLAETNEVGFFGAVVLWHLGDRDLVEPQLREKVRRWQANRLEWGVTFRWEIAYGRALLRQKAAR